MSRCADSLSSAAKRLTPLARYQADLASPEFSHDAAQAEAVRHTQRLYEKLMAPPPSAQPGWRERLLAWTGRRPAPPKPIKGLYLWGGVGRGKTYVVDCFYDCLPFEDKLRVHFHRFMHHVHGELKELREVQDPLAMVADRLRQRTRIICFDEFHVSDICDAMLLGNLLKALFERGVSLVATSNEAPDRLYWGGLQRDRFLPAIDLIKRHTRVLKVDGGVDYRLRALEQAEIYHSPLDEAADRSLAESFSHLAPEPGQPNQTLEVEGRPIPAVRLADGVAWFEFEALCGGPRAASDYIELARCFQTVLLAGIPQMDDRDNDRARRFIHLVDEFYDRNVKLICSAATTPEALYSGTALAAPFQRTVSRLREMQSHEYLSRRHLP